jgi:hypothetical protein
VDVARIGRTLGDDGPLGHSLAAVVLTATWVATWRPQVDPDAWWHIGFGDLMAEAATIPATESFSWLTAGDRIVVHSWAWDVSLAAAFRWLGTTGTSLLVLPVTALIVALMWLLVGTIAPRMSPLPRALLILAGVIAAVPMWAPRAQTLDVAFVLATVLVLARYLREGERLGLLALPPIGLLWANLHGSAVLALIATIVIGVVALPVGARLGDWPPRSPLPVLAGGLGAVIGASINPYGPGIFLYPFDREVASAFIPEIVEWRSPALLSTEFLPFTLLLVVAGSVLVTRRSARPDVFVLVTAVAWTILALSSARFVTIAACLLAVVIAPPVASLLHGSSAARQPASSGAGSAPARAGVAGLTAVGVLAIAVIGWTLIAPPAQDAAIGHRLPVAAVDALMAADCRGRLLATYGWGGYVILATGREVGAYGDSAEGPVRDQLAVELVTADPRPWLDRHRVDVVLVPTGGPLSGWLDDSSDWRAAYRDEQATIHVRADATGCSLGV